MMYAVVHYPQMHSAAIDRFRTRHDPQAGLIEPHITLVFPVPDSIGEQALVQHLESLLRNVQPVPFHLQGLQVSPDDYIFLLVREGSAEIASLHDELYTGILADHLRPDVHYVPHLTLGRLSNDAAQRERALQEAQLLAIDCYCVFDRSHLVKLKDDRSELIWSREFSLGQ